MSESPNQQNEKILKTFLIDNYNHYSDRLQAVREITYTQFHTFQEEFFKNIYYRVLVNGNLSKNRSITLVEDIQNIYQSSTLSTTADLFFYKVLKLQGKSYVYRNVTYDTKNKNTNGILNYYQIGVRDIVLYTRLHLMRQVLEEEIFNWIEQHPNQGSFGTKILSIYGIDGIFITIDVDCDLSNTEIDPADGGVPPEIHDLEYQNEVIENILLIVELDLISIVNETQHGIYEKYTKYQDLLLNILNRQNTNIIDKNLDWINEIVTMFGDVLYVEKIKKILQTTSAAELLEFYQHYFKYHSGKISIQMYCQDYNGTEIISPIDGTIEIINIYDLESRPLLPVDLAFGQVVPEIIDHFQTSEEILNESDSIYERYPNYPSYPVK